MFLWSVETGTATAHALGLDTDTAICEAPGTLEPEKTLRRSLPSGMLACAECRGEVSEALRKLYLIDPYGGDTNWGFVALTRGMAHAMLAGRAMCWQEDDTLNLVGNPFSLADAPFSTKVCSMCVELDYERISVRQL